MEKSYLHSLLGENEKIIFSARQHWFILASMIALEIFILLVIFIATIIITTMLELAAPLMGLVPVIGFLLMLIPIVSLIRDVLKWSNHQYIVTNWRVIQISGLINKNTIDSSLEKVNDVKMTQSFFGRMFNYGDIEILTASEMGVNLYRRLDSPIQFKTAMLNAKEALESGSRRAAPVMMDIPTMINQLDALRKAGTITEVEFQQKKTELLAKL